MLVMYLREREASERDKAPRSKSFSSRLTGLKNVTPLPELRSAVRM